MIDVKILNKIINEIIYLYNTRDKSGWTKIADVINQIQ